MRSRRRSGLRREDGDGRVGPDFSEVYVRGDGRRPKDDASLSLNEGDGFGSAD